jgi:hypothetical protein
MKKPQSEASSSPRVHSENIRRELSKLIEHLEADSRRVTDERFRGLLAKSGEVLKGLRSLFERFDAANSAPREKSAEAGSRKSREEKKSVVAEKPKGAAKSKEETKEKSSRSQVATRKKGEASNAATSREEAPAKVEEKQDASAPSDAAPTPATDLPATSKPEDPDEIAAKAQVQRKEARAPQRPRGSAPKPMPPQSGKPIWSKPHSA